MPFLLCFIFFASHSFVLIGHLGIHPSTIFFCFSFSSFRSAFTYFIRRMHAHKECRLPAELKWTISASEDRRVRACKSVNFPLTRDNSIYVCRLAMNLVHFSLRLAYSDPKNGKKIAKLFSICIWNVVYHASQAALRAHDLFLPK